MVKIPEELRISQLKGQKPSEVTMGHHLWALPPKQARDEDSRDGPPVESEVENSESPGRLHSGRSLCAY